MKKITILFLSAFIIYLLFSIFNFAIAADSGVPGLSSVGTGGTPSGGIGSLQNALGVLMALLMVFAVVTSLLFLIWGGFFWITSGGDKQKIHSAQQRIVFAIVGLIVVFLAFAIIGLVNNFFFGTGSSGGGGGGNYCPPPRTCTAQEHTVCTNNCCQCVRNNNSGGDACNQAGGACNTQSRCNAQHGTIDNSISCSTSGEVCCKF